MLLNCLGSTVKLVGKVCHYKIDESKSRTKESKSSENHLRMIITVEINLALGTALSLLDLTLGSYSVFHIWPPCGLAEVINASRRILQFCQTAMLH